MTDKLAQKQKNRIVLHRFCMKMHAKITTNVQSGRNWPKNLSLLH